MIVNTQHESNNYWDNNDPRSIMLHTTGGNSVIGAVETLLARGLSYNYLIKGGVVYELVHYNKCAWHAGVVRGMNLRAKSFYGTGKGVENPNRHSVGIAFATTNPLTDEEIDQAVLLIKELGKKTGLRFTADNIFYHREVTSDKPIIVKRFREQVLEALVGDKDDKDSYQQTILKLMLKVAQLQLKILLRKLSLSK